MSRAITFSRTFPAYHPRKGQDTNFVEQIWNSLNELKLPVPKNKDLPDAFMWSILPLSNFGSKHHTIRAGNRWKVGDKFSPRCWSGKPYASKQITIAPDIELKNIWDVHIEFIESQIFVMKPTDDPNHYLLISAGDIAKNDGLDVHDFINWFKIHPKKKEKFIGQILCWNENINY